MAGEHNLLRCSNSSGCRPGGLWREVLESTYGRQVDPERGGAGDGSQEAKSGIWCG